MQNTQFPVLMAVSYAVFVFLLRIVLRQRKRFPLNAALVLGLFVVCAGMVFAKYGAMSGLPWWVYYTIPMLLTVFLPPFVLRMRTREFVAYLLLSFLSAPAIHAAFSFFFGWKTYMPFIDIPSFWEL